MFKIQFRRVMYAVIIGYGCFMVGLKADPLDLNKPPKEVNLDIHPTDVIKWSAVSARSYSDGYTTVTLNLNTIDQFTIYDDHLSFFQDGGWLFIDVISPPTKTIADPLTGKKVKVYDQGQFVVLFQGFKQHQAATFELKVKFLGCTSRLCLFPYTQKLSVPNHALSEVLPQHVSDQFLATKALPEESEVKADILSSAKRLPTTSTFILEDYLAGLLSRPESIGFFFLLGIALLGGMLTNLTPCVYPMIPITLRILGRQTRSPLLASCCYASGIVVSYSVLGVVAILTGSLFGQLMANVTFNLVVSLVMFALAWTMLGFGRFASLQEVGSRFGSSKKGIWRTFFMGMGAGLIASPCTGPILASLLTYTTMMENKVNAVFLVVAYSFGFGLPYIVLGRLASTLTRFKLPGVLQNMIKVVFASIMFALAFYFLRIPLYSVHQSLLGFWKFLTVGAAIIACVLFLITDFVKRRLQHVFIILPTMILGFSLFASSQWLLTRGSEKSRTELVWLKQEDLALTQAANQKRPLLIDVWAEWCESCKKMDITTFANDQVIKELKEKHWVLLKLDLTLDNEKNNQLRKKYEVKGLPSVIIIPADSNKQSLRLNGFVSTQLLYEKITSMTKQL